MTIKWNKVAGAQSYTVYVKYPGNSSYKKAATTSANSFRLNNMTLGTRYYVKIAANKKVGKKTWQSDKNSAYYLYLRRVWFFYNQGLTDITNKNILKKQINGELVTAGWEEVFNFDPYTWFG